MGEILRPADEFCVFHKSEQIFAQHDRGTLMFIVKSGIVEMRLSNTEIEHIDPGGFFGEMALLDSTPRMMSAVALSDCTLKIVGRECFQYMVSQIPNFAIRVLRCMAQRLRKLDHKSFIVHIHETQHAHEMTSGYRGIELYTNVKNMKSVQPDEIIFRQGEPGEHMYCVKSGKVQLTVDDAIVETLGPGGIFGEMALLEDEPRSATALALTTCELIKVDKERFEYLMGLTPFFVIQIMRVMTHRLREMASEFERANEPGDPVA